jgi:iron complex outermembrane receptor protein
MGTKYKSIICAFAAHTPFWGAIPAVAQTGATEDRSGDIVVTARRREESLQNVPVAITALTSEALRTQRVVNYNDLTSNAVGLTVATVGSGQSMSFNLRGQGKVYGTAAPGVQVYLDEFPLTDGYVDFYDLAGLEVLRGPQGTLFGRNTTGGAIRLRPVRPSNSLDGYARVVAGNLDALVLEGAVNMPIINDVLAIRVSGNKTRRDGFVKNITVGEDMQDQHGDSARVQVKFNPSANFENLFMFDYYRRKQNASAYMAFRPAAIGFPPIDAQLAAGYAVSAASKYRQVASLVDSEDSQKRHTFEDIASLEIGSITLRNILHYTSNKSLTSYDMDGSLAVFTDLYGAVGTEKLFTEEFQVLGGSPTGFEWIVGGYYEDRKSNGIVTARTFLGQQVSSNDGRQKSKALFGQGTLNLDGLTEGLSAVAGFRYTWDTRSFKGGSVLPVPGPFTTQHFKAPSWTLGLNYQVSSDLLLYLASRRGYKAGGFNLSQTPGFPYIYNPEKLTDFELGLKSQWRSGGMTGRLNVAAFYGKFNDIQRYNVVPVPPLIIAYTYNAGKARIQGLEIEGMFSPVPALEFNVLYAYTDSKFEVYRDPVTGTSFLGTPFAYTPKHKLTLGARFHLFQNERLGDLSAAGTYYHQSANPLAEPPTIVQRSYDIANFSIDWNSIASAPIDASLFIKNAFDKLYFTGLGVTSVNSVIRAEPRTFGIELRYRFGASASH